ncbi:MAG TPA: PEP-utilizing enzyme [Aeromicrobium sp.]|nr:PEP-utilizing enzyme [Aeromicrobium sp.]
MAELTWEPPSKGAWELETTHASRPWTRFTQKPFAEGFVRGFQRGTAHYGLMLDHLAPGFVNGFMYNQPRPFGAPPGAAPPPKPVLWALTRLHPKMRARIREGAKAFEEKRWRADLEHWDAVDKPAAIEKHRAIQDVDVRSLSDEELADHIAQCHQHLIDSIYLHHKYTVPSVLLTGDFLAGVQEWTGVAGGPVLQLLRGTSEISHGFGARELSNAADAIRASSAARAILGDGTEPNAALLALMDDSIAGTAVSAYLDAVRYRCVGYDVGDQYAEEMPELLLDTLRAAAQGVTVAAPRDDSAEAALREQVPQEHRADFDARLAEARLINRLRDERDAYSDGWATGLARRALLEAGRRLAATAHLNDADHAVDLDVDEVTAPLRGGTGPSAEEVAERFKFRTTHTTDDAPPLIGGEMSPPPDPAQLPAAARRGARAMDAALFNLFGVPDTPNSGTVLHGLAVNTGVYEGPARLVDDPSDFGRIKSGDVLVTRMTSPYFNVVLPLLGALVTDRGGQLCHAAIVAREYGIPGIVGTREATAKIADGARVRVDGTTGEVHLLG